MINNICLFLFISLLLNPLMAGEQKVVLISGSTGGLGLATVQAFEAQGWKVWAGYHQKMHKALTNRRDVCPIALDVTDEASIQRALSLILQEDGHLDVLVNNAGYGLIGAEERVRIDEAQKLFEVNFFGALCLTQAVLPSMRAQHSGHIINISSTSGVRAVPGLGLYAASKFALEGLSESLAITLSPWNIRVSLVEPGSVHNDWAHHCKLAQASNPCYARLQKNLLSKLIEAADGGQDPNEIGRLIVKIAQTEVPDLRYQTSAKVKETVERKLVDPSGNQMKEQQLHFFQSLVESTSP